MNPPAASPASSLPSPALTSDFILDRIRVVMLQTSHPGNVGSAARAMKTMGLTDLVLVSPKFPDVQVHPDAVALSAGASDTLAGARIVNSLEEALADCHFALASTSRRRELSHGVAPIREAAQTLLNEVRASITSRGALVFGNETYGMSNEEIDRCQMIAMIPTNAEFRSLNVAQAVQLAAYEVMMAAGNPLDMTEPPRPAASISDVDGFLRHLYAGAVAAEFLDPEEPKRFMTRMRRLFTRARMEPEEVAILRGLLAALLKRP